MTIGDTLAFGASALRGHSLRTALSLLGVAVGVTSVVLLTSLGEGARLYITGEFASLGSNLLIVTPGKTDTTGFAPPIGGAPHDLTIGDIDALQKRVAGVRRAAPMSLGSATARYSDLTRETVVVGATAAWKDVRRVEMRVGQFLPATEADADRPVCVIGARLEEELFRGRNALGEHLRLGDERFRVIGIMAARGTNLGMNLDEVVIVPLGRHMKMFNRTTIFRALVEVTSHDALPAVRRSVIEAIKARHDNEEDVTVMTQDSLLATFSRLLAMLTAALAGIAAISLSVAGVGIMNVMLVSVSERTSEIGLLKAIGATPGQVLRIFVAEAATLSAVGGLAGLAVALALSAAVRRLYPIFPMQPPPWAIPAALLVSLAVGMLFGVLPAQRAARLDPIQALTRR
jgi:putative ABC transport system permease protein